MISMSERSRSKEESTKISLKFLKFKRKKYYFKSYSDLQNKKDQFKTLSIPNIFIQNKNSTKNKCSSNDLKHQSKNSVAKPPSLRNFSTNCYLNSSLQGISSCEKFVDEIRVICKEHGCHSKKLILFYDLLSFMNNITENKRQCKDISRNKIFRKWNKFSQQDSFELLAFLLKEIYHEIKICKKNGDENMVTMDDGFNISLPMRCIFTSQIICGCGSTIKIPLHSDIALHVIISNQGTKELQKLIDNFFNKDHIEGYKCSSSSCDGKNAFKITLFRQPLPQTICVHLQKASYDGHKLNRVNEKVTFEEKIFIKSKFCSNEGLTDRKCDDQNNYHCSTNILLSSVSNEQSNNIEFTHSDNQLSSEIQNAKNYCKSPVEKDFAHLRLNSKDNNQDASIIKQDECVPNIHLPNVSQEKSNSDTFPLSLEIQNDDDNCESPIEEDSLLFSLNSKDNGHDISIKIEDKSALNPSVPQDKSNINKFPANDNRLSFQNHNTSENENKTRFSRSLSSKDISVKEEDECFTLKSVIVHCGTLKRGHYICYKLFNKVWFRTNDSKIECVSVSEVLNSDAYILFYEKS